MATKIYRGQDREWQDEAASPIVFFTADFDLAAAYAREEWLYEAEMGEAMVKGDHSDFLNPQIAIEDGGAWCAEILCEQGADYFVHDEGRPGAPAVTYGVLRESMHKLTGFGLWEN